MTQSEKEKVKKLIGNNDLEKAINLLRSSAFSEVGEDLDLFYARFVHLKNKLTIGTISTDEYTRESNRVRINLLEIIDSLDGIQGNTPRSLVDLFKTIFSDTLVIIAGISAIIASAVYWGIGFFSNSSGADFILPAIFVVLAIFIISRIIYTYLGNVDENPKTQDDSIRIEIQKLKDQVASFDELDKAKLISEIKGNITDELFKDLQESIPSELKRKKRFNLLSESLEESQYRLQREVSSLNKKANLNLSIGVVTTIIAVGFLIYSSTGIQTEFKDWFSFISYYIPRLSLVIFVEIFSYYFLVLYKSSLGEIKHYQNELTNVELKMLAFRSTLLGEDEDHLKHIINELIKTERNQVLKKDETTISLEKYRSDSELHRMVLQYLPSLDSFKQYMAGEKNPSE